VTKSSKVEIVFRRKVRSIWLEEGAALAAKGLPWDEAKPVLIEPIAAENPGAETIRKVLEHIRRIWFEPPGNCAELRSTALEMVRSDNSPVTQNLLTWGMTIAAYPFVGSAAEVVGRLLKLQKQARRTDIQRRLREQYGDRDFVNRIARYTVSSFLDWGVLLETKPKGVYFAGKQTTPKSQKHLAWLAEAAMISRDKTQIGLSELCNHPALFPFVLDNLNAIVLQSNPRIRVERQSLNQEVVFLKVLPP
jgi:hypothetical protein